jgi:hypothetical protein
MLRIACIVGLIAGCAHMGPKRNELVAKAGRQIKWRGPIASATFCPTCGQTAPVIIEFGTPPHVKLVIASCYAHAASKIGDHDHMTVELVDGAVPAVEGELDITDCTTTHVIATLWAKFPGDQRIDADIDTDLTNPGK